MKYLIYLLFIFGCFDSISSQPLPKSTTDTNDREFMPYENVFEQLINLKPVEGKVANVFNITLVKDKASFELIDGKIYLLSPVRNRWVAALFLGNGIFSFQPPTNIERDQLYRFYDTRDFQQEFNTLFFICADSTIENFNTTLKFKDVNINKHVEVIIKNCLQYISDDDRKYFNRAILKTFLNNEYNQLFYSHFSQEDLHPFFYMINPYENEEVRFMRRIETFYPYQLPETICQFHIQDDHLHKSTHEKNMVNIHHYRLESTIDDDMDFAAAAEIEFETSITHPAWIDFDLYFGLQIDSAFWNNGHKVKYFKGDDNYTLWVYIEPKIKSSENIKLSLYYHGDLIESKYDGNYIKSSAFWYPRYGGRQTTATYEMTFHTPKNLTFVAVGKKLSAKIDGNVQTSYWIVPFPVRNVAFNIGDYKVYVTKNPNLPSVKVYLSESRSEITDHSLGLMRADNEDNVDLNVGNEIVTSTYFFQSIFGKAPISDLSVTETPYAHGLAFPGLIHLGSQYLYQGRGKSGLDFVIRAHEVAHQWWGIGMDFETYHDQWISEGLATFCGLWYLQRVLKANNKYFDLLSSWQDEIINNRKFLFADGQESGPVWLGYRTSTSTTQNDYNLLIYKKGAWIFHMLRNMMLDFDSMTEERFRNMLHDLYASYRATKVSTEKLQALLEKHFDSNMDWFFKQWVYGTDIPEYKVYHRTVTGPKYGLFSEIFYIEQTNVNNDFQMVVPISIQFDNNKKIIRRTLVKGPVSTFSIPNLPAIPEKVTFNAFNSVLSKVEYEDWQD